MRSEGKTRGSAPGKARYVFAGSKNHDGEDGTKICPRCGQILFTDMDVCYGCLYDFTRDHHGNAGGGPVPGRALRDRLRAVPSVSDPLDAIDLDEIDDEEERQEPRVPRHRKEDQTGSFGGPDDTLDLSPVRSSSEPTMVDVMAGALFELVVSTDDLQVRMPLGKEPVTVGRDETNTIVLRNRAVSRRHMRVSCEEGVVTVTDCGATNPARLQGVPLAGEATLHRGDVVDVCGTQVTIA